MSYMNVKILVRSFAVLILLSFFSCNFLMKNHAVLPESSNTVKLILMNPTVKNIKTIEYLSDNGLLCPSKKIVVTGVYHEQSAYKFVQTERYLKKKMLDNISLVRMISKKESEPVYGLNSWSDEFNKLFQENDAAFFMGGPDIPPLFYGQDVNLLTIIEDYYRHELELSFLFHLLGGSQDSLFVPLLERKPGFAILGICLGMQSMNVATGGDLIQDIPTLLYEQNTLEDVLKASSQNSHRNYYVHYGEHPDVTWGCFHQIFPNGDSEFSKYLYQQDSMPYVLSIHHQCIDKLGKGILPVALGQDGKVIEAIAHQKYPNVLGVQFHPEAIELYDTTSVFLMYKGQDALFSYKSLYPENKGLFFHQGFWELITEKISVKP